MLHCLKDFIGAASAFQLHYIKCRGEKELSGVEFLMQERCSRKSDYKYTLIENGE